MPCPPGHTAHPCCPQLTILPGKPHLWLVPSSQAQDYSVCKASGMRKAGPFPTLWKSPDSWNPQPDPVTHLGSQISKVSLFCVAEPRFRLQPDLGHSWLLKAHKAGAVWPLGLSGHDTCSLPLRIRGTKTGPVKEGL